MFNFAAVKRFYGEIVSSQIREYTGDIGKEFLLPLEFLFLDLLFLLGLAPPLSGPSGGVEDDEVATFTAAFEQSNGW